MHLSMHENNESFKDKKDRVRKAAETGDDFPYEKSDDPDDLHGLYLLCISRQEKAKNNRIPAEDKKALREKNFEPIRLIGKGGQGIVYEAKERVKGRKELVGDYAIKILSSDLDSCMDEIKKMDRIKSEFIVKVHRPYILRLEDGRLALLMDLVPGKSLYKYIQEEEKPTVRLILRIMTQICEGMKEAAEKKVNHRDLKPSNILITNLRLRVVIIDLGLSSYSNIENPLPAKPSLSIRAGTAHCVAPEQAKNPEAADEKSDIYGLGATMYYVVTGEIPFEQLSEEKVWKLKKGAKPIEDIEDLLEPSTLNSEVKGKLNDLIMKCLQTDPARRPETFQEVIDALVEIGKDLDRKTQDKGLHESIREMEKARTPEEKRKVLQDLQSNTLLHATDQANQGERGKNARSKKKRSAKRRQNVKSESPPSTETPIEVKALNLDGREPIASPQKPVEDMTESSTQDPEAEGLTSLIKTARDFKKKGDLDTAIELCCIVLRKERENIKALLLKAGALTERKKKGDLDTAIKLCRRVLQKDPRNIAALLLRARAYIERDRNEK